MRAYTTGRNALLIFEEDVGAALTKACELDSDDDVVHLERAAQTVPAICLKNASPSTDSLKDAKKIMCHHCTCPGEHGPRGSQH